MKKYFWFLVLLPVIGILAMRNNTAVENSHSNKTLKWYSWKEAVELNKKSPRKLLVDVYTDWCGWCKKMDASTFPNDTIADYLNKHFYCVKFDAEGQDTIYFSGRAFTWVSPEKSGGSRGIHELAYALLDGRLGYPSIVYLNEKFERIIVSPGYKTPAELLPEIRFAAEEIYKTKSWEEFKNSKAP